MVVIEVQVFKDENDKQKGKVFATMSLDDTNIQALENLIPLIDRLGKVGQAFGLTPK